MEPTCVAIYRGCSFLAIHHVSEGYKMLRGLFIQGPWRRRAGGSLPFRKDWHRRFRSSFDSFRSCLWRWIRRRRGRLRIVDGFHPDSSTRRAILRACWPASLTLLCHFLAYWWSRDVFRIIGGFFLIFGSLLRIFRNNRGCLGHFLKTRQKNRLPDFGLSLWSR